MSTVSSRHHPSYRKVPFSSISFIHLSSALFVLHLFAAGEDNSVIANSGMSFEGGWYVLGQDQQQIGPYTAAELREHYSSGYLVENTLVWTEGRTDWQPLSSIPGLLADIPQQSTGYPTGVTSVNDEDEFEKFQKEVKEAEAEINDDLDRPSTPPEGEEEFTDDDGEDEVFPTPGVDDSPKKEVEDNGRVDGSTTVQESKESDETKEATCSSKRKLPEKMSEKKEANKPPDSWFELKVNTHVYVTGLPEDVTLDEVSSVTTLVREHLYENATSSVGPCSVPRTKQWLFMQIVEEFSKMIIRTGMDLGLIFWVEMEIFWDIRTEIDLGLRLSGGRDDAKVSIPATVLLRNMFTPAELRADENLRPELEADVKEECAKLGPVDSVKVCENHPRGVILVRFKDRKDARKCIEMMNGRWFAGRTVHASEDDGSVNHALVRDWEGEAERLEKFGAELETDD
nr:splicing factor U2AF-associated protein 2 [Ipomoea batatas]